MRGLHITALVLAIIGAINWGLIVFFNFDLVAAIFGGQAEPISRISYALVGLAGLVLLFTGFSAYSTEGRYAGRRTTTHPSP